MNWIRKQVSDYYWKLMNVPGQINDVAIGFAIGVFIAFSPWVGFHTILAFLIVLALRKSVAAGILGTLVMNPVTGPFIYTLEFELGKRVLHYRRARIPSDFTFEVSTLHSFWHTGMRILLPITVGSVIIGAAAAVIAYFLLRRSLQAYRAKVYLKRIS
jgi:uncharacterized protein (DUF2062 family)